MIGERSNIVKKHQQGTHVLAEFNFDGQENCDTFKRQGTQGRESGPGLKSVVLWVVRSLANRSSFY